MDNNSLYNPPIVAKRIKDYAKIKKIQLKQILNDCQLGSNTFSHMLHGRSLAFDSLAKIADYLDCSVDYLLGRTSNPNAHKEKEPILMIENEPRYLVRRAGRDGSYIEEYLTKEELDKEIEKKRSLPDATDL